MRSWTRGPCAAAEYLGTEDSERFPDSIAVRNWARKVWFEPFTNEYAAPEPYCCGFEHVFVGEIQREAVIGDNKMDVGGYHSWVKYVLDQAAGVVDYLGHDYTPAVAAAGKANAREASVIMTWTVEGNEYLKNPGGFFCGDLPEMQIALGMVGVFDSLRGRFGGTGASGKSTDRKVSFWGDQIDLVVYPQTMVEEGRRVTGEHLRSMYPKYRGTAGTQPAPGPGLPHTPHNDGPVRITAALPNPEGTDEIGEWVEIVNASQHSVDLSNRNLRDSQHRAVHLGGTLQPGDLLRIDLRRTSSESMQLGNNGGWILLFEDTERIAAVRYGPADSGAVVRFG